MAKAPAQDSLNPTRADFEALLAESFGTSAPAEGQVVKGLVVAVENDNVIIDVGLKTEGRVPVKEFSQPGKDVSIKPGDEVEVYLERIENALGEAVLSRENARPEEAWPRHDKSI